MLYAGQNLTSSSDKLVKVPLDYLFHSIKNPKEEILSKIRQIRIVRDIDSKRYSALKRTLPYIVCGCFNPPFRRTENFAFIEYFFIDIDHISSKGIEISDLRARIEGDNRTEMCFTSPGEDGLKVLFHLKEKCYDHGLFSMFYRAFAQSFSLEYDLSQVIDAKTCDVSRACFISVDPEVYFNKDAEPIDLNNYLQTTDTFALFEKDHELLCKESESAGNEKSIERDKDPDRQTIDKIKQILELKAVKVEKNEAYVPEQIEDVMGDIQKLILETGIEIVEIRNISWGKKLILKLGIKKADVNIFYGKRGYTVTYTPSGGTDKELNETAVDLIKSYFA